MTTVFDVAVIGGGIAGCALAAHLAGTLRVVVLERESQPGYHATGRSAAAFSQTYGSALIRALTRAGRAFLDAPPAEFASSGLIARHGAMYIAREDQLEALHAFAAPPDIAAHVRRIEPAVALALTPCLREAYVAQALFEADSGDIDVHAMQQGYLRRLRARGGALVTDAHVQAIARTPRAWELDTANGRFAASVLVNAAGAWVDEIASLAQVKPLGIRPLRRTACVVDVPSNMPCVDWPLTVDIGGAFYFKPDAGRLLLSPADETPSLPCDAWPDDGDVRVAVDRVERATTLTIAHVRQAWAGLRSFLPDGNPAIGFDARVPDFFWLAGLGGCGIQTAPAVARLAAALLRCRPVPADLLAQGLRVSEISPLRLRDCAGAAGPSMSRESA